MLLSSTFVISLLSLSGLALGQLDRGSFLQAFPNHIYRARAIRMRQEPKPSRGYRLNDHWEGNAFFNDWNFFSGDDPTHGNVNYQTREQAIAKRLAYVENGAAVLAVDDFSQVPVGGRRDSVRIHSKKTFDRGLFIADFAAMPHGCSVWPAYWSVGDDWPNGGEIDIIEGINNQPTNQYTLHTSIPCTLPNNASVLGLESQLIWNVCQTLPTDNRGCGFLDPDTRSYGAGLNAAGGGVFAHEWNDDGVKIWFFPRSEIPADIIAQRPNPASWGTPIARWLSDHCDIAEALTKHTLIIDTTICGDWAAAGYPTSGCPGTCAEAVANPENFRTAKWRINYLSVYQS